MELDRQLQVLIDDAASYGVPPVAIKKAIAPVLRLFANKLQHWEYYILQNLENDWVLTTITNPQLKQTKNVIYAFVSVQDAAAFGGKTNPDLIAMPIGIAQLLFRLFSLQQVDSIIFLENSPNFNQGVEIERSHLSELIQQQIQQLNNIPPDLA
ncbi:hypothetical protein I4641_02000 [Waterburya agarophytonicola K14]|uniref:Uncharacterized protein n=1 Tax=Waterburya agarophytonicola KI4 TaxID=2874699 RepID=A0A964FED5_9CYAN|nr:hypothetical protein [Waterburya agarophytonicola]MCC0175752.1 hypothetical protein [Waterburya agarophytonicola KI4]